VTGGNTRGDDAASSSSSSSSSDEERYQDVHEAEVRQREKGRKHLLREREEDRRPGSHILGQVTCWLREGG
jgi:hypothetical protein